MSKPKTMPQAVWDYAMDLRLHGMRNIEAAHLITAAWLVEAGYAYAENDREGPRIGLTAAGNKLANR